MSPSSRSPQTARRSRGSRPSMPLARVLLLLCLGAHALGQTFQYSRGWTNGRKRSFVEPALVEDNAAKEDTTLGHPTSSSEGSFLDELVAQPRGGVPTGTEGRAISLGRGDQGRLEALLVVLGGAKEDASGADGLEMDALRQNAAELAASRRRGAWRRSSLNEIFLRRRKRRAGETSHLN